MHTRMANWKGKHEYTSDKYHMETAFNATTVNTSAVAAVGSFLFGSAASVDIHSRTVKNHTVALSTKAHHDSTITVGLSVVLQQLHLLLD
jgi:hypothetical protein